MNLSQALLFRIPSFLTQMADRDVLLGRRAKALKAIAYSEFSGQIGDLTDNRLYCQPLGGESFVVLFGTSIVDLYQNRPPGQDTSKRRRIYWGEAVSDVTAE